MNKPFDFEAAKSGETVEYKLPIMGQWIPVHFIGLADKGQAVFQTPDSTHFFIGHPDMIRMAPKKVTVRYRNYLMQSFVGPAYVETMTEGFEIENYPASSSSFIGWIHAEWQTAEIEE